MRVACSENSAETGLFGPEDQLAGETTTRLAKQDETRLWKALKPRMRNLNFTSQAPMGREIAFFCFNGLII